MHHHALGGAGAFVEQGVALALGGFDLGKPLLPLARARLVKRRVARGQGRVPRLKLRALFRDLCGQVLFGRFGRGEHPQRPDLRQGGAHFVLRHESAPANRQGAQQTEERALFRLRPVDHGEDQIAARDKQRDQTPGDALAKSGDEDHDPAAKQDEPTEAEQDESGDRQSHADAFQQDANRPAASLVRGV